MQPQPTPGEYVVQPGDTLSTVALRFNTSMAALQILNDIEDVRVIRAGQRLKLPTQRLAEEESPFWIAHRVRPGETASTIAQRYRVDLNDMLRVNRLSDASRVIAGQWLVIPTRAPVTP